MRRIAVAVIVLCSLALLTASCRRSPQGYLEKGNELVAAGKNDEAILNYRKAIQGDAQFGEAYYRLATAELKAGHAGAAYPALVTANRLLPRRSDVKESLADFLLLIYIGDQSRPQTYYTQLTQLSDELIASDPQSFDGLRIKGYLAWSDSKLKEAEEFLRKANAVKPMVPDVIVLWVQVLFRDGRDAEAEQLAGKLIAAHKDAGMVYDALFTHYRAKNRLPDAENVLRTKVNNNPHSIDYVLDLAGFYAASGKRDQMAGVLKPLSDDPKDFPDAHLKVGDFYTGLHDWAEGLQQYQEGIKADSKNKTIYLKRIADSWLSQGKGDEAAGVIGEILKERPNDDEAKAVNASLLIKTGKPEKIQAGVADFQNLVKNNPDNVAFRYSLAQALLVQNDAEGARTQLQELLKKQPRHLPTIATLAELSLSKKDYSQALQYLDSALAINPRLERVRLLRTTALIGQTNYSEARVELNSLAAEAPQNIDVQFQLASLDLAEKKLPQAETRLLQLYDKQKLMALNMLVEVYVAEGLPDKAISRLTMELAKSPNTVPIHSMLAETLMRQGKYGSAIDQYKQMQILGVRSTQLQMRLGTAHRLSGDLDKAIASFQEARVLAPHDPMVEGALADALRLAGRNSEAIASYRRLLSLDSENANAMNNLAYIILDTGGSTDEAQKLEEQALRKAPTNQNYADTLGMVYLRRNLKDSAYQVFNGLVQRFPDDPVFRYHYALTLTQKGQKEQAKNELAVALSKNPSNDLRRSIQSSLAEIQK
jgi:tetratricopeptide (TPR) repeat protein